MSNRNRNRKHLNVHNHMRSHSVTLPVLTKKRLNSNRGSPRALHQNAQQANLNRVWKLDSLRENLNSSPVAMMMEHDHGDDKSSVSMQIRVEESDARSKKRARQVAFCFIRTQAGKIIRLEADTCFCIRANAFQFSPGIHMANVKERLEEETGIPACEMKVLYDKRVFGLDEDVVIASGSFLHIISQVGSSSQREQHCFRPR
uniref:Ubiquitin-like domain-containing protein n=1 Tax=Aplanochytrium stocchinoi TaxID=215587 RepID=A0A7S3PHX0_9STRA|mmetsp:Transcript_23916/g.29311  ORF Transcript_23916/g.29311 Transcript_23916/m.29311 type:complete len:202 (-) Transcript_23916:200-805(-)